MNLTPAEVAKRLGCSDRHVKRLIDDRTLEGIDISRAGAQYRRWVVPLTEVERFERSRSFRSARQPNKVVKRRPIIV